MITCLLACLTSLTLAVPIDYAKLTRVTGEVLAQRGTAGSFVLYDNQHSAMLRSEPSRSRQPLSPASTFKILNALIALETGVLKDEHQVMAWDGVTRPVETWNQDQTLATGMKYSTVWAYQWIARKVGRERMQHFLDFTGYGNGQIGDQIDGFWLDNSLLISPEEQVEFLRDLYHNRLPFKPRHMATVRDLLTQEQTEQFHLSGKTGWGVNSDPHNGWFVGYLEQHDNVWFFALSVDIHEDRRGRDRLAIARDILKKLGLAAQ